MQVKVTVAASTVEVCVPPAEDVPEIRIVSVPAALSVVPDPSRFTELTKVNWSPGTAVGSVKVTVAVAPTQSKVLPLSFA